jgi:hypothetical protein
MPYKSQTDGVLARHKPCLGVMFRLVKAMDVTLLEVFALTEQLYREGFKRAPRNAKVL